MLNWKGNLVPALLASLALLAACGGGGGSKKSGAVEADKDFPAAAASQAFAGDAVDDVNDLAEQIVQADAAGGIGLPIAARITGPLTGATSSGSIDCADWGQSGSGTIDYSYTYSSSNRPVSYSFTYNNCQYTSGEYTTTLSGTMNIVVNDWDDESHFTFTYNYNLTYTFTGPNVNETYTISSSETCTTDGENYECRYRVGGGYTLDDYDVAYEDGIITVYSATITTKNGTIEFTNWVYDTSLGYATSGTILVTYNNGNAVEITATGAGYDVIVTINGVEYPYFVPVAT